MCWRSKWGLCFFSPSVPPFTQMSLGYPPYFPAGVSGIHPHAEQITQRLVKRKLLTISDCLHKFRRFVNLHSFHCVYISRICINSTQTVFSAISVQMQGLRTTAGPVYGAYRLNTKGQVSCNPTALFHPYPKGHLANYLPKHILKLQIIGSVWY